ncbi:hypothetical protein, partial [Actinoallomurus acaciae]
MSPILTEDPGRATPGAPRRAGRPPGSLHRRCAWRPGGRCRSGPSRGRRWRRRLRHPLIRSTIYHAAPFGARAEAHRWPADALREVLDRRA